MEQLRLKYEELECVNYDASGVEVMHYKGTPFTGILLYYNENEILEEETEYQNGYLEGTRNGIMQVES